MHSWINERKKKFVNVDLNKCKPIDLLQDFLGLSGNAV